MADEQVGYGLYQNQPVNKNDLLSTRFRLLIKRLPNTTYACQAVTLPGLEIFEVEQHTTFNTIKRPGGEVKHERLSVKFIVDENLANWKEIRNWILQCSNYTDFDLYRNQIQHFSDEVTLFALTNTHNITHKFTFMNCFPVKLHSVQFDSTPTGSEVILATMELAFTNYEVVTS